MSTLIEVPALETDERRQEGASRPHHRSPVCCRAKTFCRKRAGQHHGSKVPSKPNRLNGDRCFPKETPIAAPRFGLRS
jgi:hypothetical protein